MKEAEYGLTDNFIFREAVEFLKMKRPLTQDEYKRMNDESRAKAFTVSGYTSAEVLQQFLTELIQACEEGKTKREFAASMNDFLIRNGYEGMNAHKADVIFRTNMQTAYNAGHYRSMTEPTTKKLRPYWKYVTAGDGHVRITHAEMEGRIYAADDPIWDVWFPPNGFRCRCTVVSMTKKQVERSGIPVSTMPPFGMDMDTGEMKIQYPDTGFSNNPAKSAWKPDLSGMDSNVKKAYQDRGKSLKGKNV